MPHVFLSFPTCHGFNPSYLLRIIHYLSPQSSRVVLVCLVKLTFDTYLLRFKIGIGNIAWCFPKCSASSTVSGNLSLLVSGIHSKQSDPINPPRPNMAALDRCKIFGTKEAYQAANGPVWMPQALKPLCLIQFWSWENSLFWLLAFWGNKNGLPSMKVEEL